MTLIMENEKSSESLQNFLMIFLFMDQRGICMLLSLSHSNIMPRIIDQKKCEIWKDIEDMVSEESRLCHHMYSTCYFKNKLCVDACMKGC